MTPRLTVRVELTPPKKRGRRAERVLSKRLNRANIELAHSKFSAAGEFRHLFGKAPKLKQTISEQERFDLEKLKGFLARRNKLTQSERREMAVIRRRWNVKRV